MMMMVMMMMIVVVVVAANSFNNRQSFGTVHTVNCDCQAIFCNFPVWNLYLRLAK